MRNTFFRRQSTHLNYNAPTISIAIQPTDATVSNGSTATFTGIATVQFNSADNSGSGSFSYQWYEGTSPVVSSGNITVTGAATTVLTIENPINPDDDERQFYLKATFTPTYTGIATENPTPPAPINYVDSDTATLIVHPSLTIGSIGSAEE